MSCCPGEPRNIDQAFHLFSMLAFLFSFPHLLWHPPPLTVACLERGDLRRTLDFRFVCAVQQFLRPSCWSFKKKMFDRNDGQSLTMRQAGQEQYQQESGGSSRSSSGSDGRSGRRGQPHQIRSARQSNSATVVPAFTIRSASQGRVQPPKRVNVFAERPSPSLAFRRIYQRGDLPVCIVHESRLYRLGWKVTEKPVI